MNFPTTRCTTPAATPRTGRGECALPHPDPGAKTQLPFAALPHDLRKDPGLRGKDKAILLAAALLEYACDQASCYPTNARLAAGPGMLRTDRPTALAPSRPPAGSGSCSGPHQPNGRTIWLSGAGADSRGPAPRAPGQVPDTPPIRGPLPQPTGAPRQPSGGQSKKKRESEERNVTDFISPPDRQSAVPLAPLPHPQSSATPPSRLVTAPPPPTVPATGPQRVLAPNRPDPARGPLKDALKALPGASQDQVRQSAWRLAHHLTDTASIGIFHQRAWPWSPRAWRRSSGFSRRSRLPIGRGARPQARGDLCRHLGLVAAGT